MAYSTCSVNFGGFGYHVVVINFFQRDQIAKIRLYYNYNVIGNYNRIYN